ncbi:hypothetical protein F4X33_20900 [Candidatus Poribacteria bacterium]|nr:hypothetical protein [Candidatus Poribacteria bacterium]
MAFDFPNFDDFGYIQSGKGDKLMFFFGFRILGRTQHQHLINQQKNLRRQVQELEEKLKTLATEQDELEARHQAEKSALNHQLETLRQTAQDHDDLQQRIAEDVERVAGEFGLSSKQIEKLWADRLDLIDLYADKLYLLAKDFAYANREMRKNRGLFLLLIDRRNMDEDNFSEFHDAQIEHLTEEQYQGLSQLPQIFSSKINDIFRYMGEKVILKDKSGEITGHEERDGAILIDLSGLAFRSRVMVEGVRTHRVFDKVERLHKGSARHNAAIYASSLDEVMVSIVVSEETSEVTLFRDGRFIESYDPYTDQGTLREEKVVPMKRKDSSEETTDVEIEEDETAIQVSTE